MTGSPLTRFAPAPTGLLHLGHVVNAIFVWGLARQLGGRVLLRIEDHDRQRSRPAFEAQLLDDLDWLGFVPDIYPTSDFRRGPCPSRQSDRNAIYAAVARRLAAEGRLYGCTCTRQEIARRAGRQTSAYPGWCRDRGIALGPGVTWRVRMDPGEVAFTDLLRGPVRQQPALTHGDVAIRDRHGNWTYMFAVVVDDLLQDVDLIVRGVDLFDATGPQIALAALIGRSQPARFAHHPLVMKGPEQKLSKADGDTGIPELRRRGMSPAAVIGHAARLVDLIADEEEISAEEVARLVRLDQLASR